MSHVCVFDHVAKHGVYVGSTAVLAVLDGYDYMTAESEYTRQKDNAYISLLNRSKLIACKDGFTT
ncbi:hypothetical protein Barb6_02354 [Bacteroidales bacterium Barb6]|nr:hypothetical protein Barb6_02354 [Bacteroidales bacterium Barb6]